VLSLVCGLGALAWYLRLRRNGDIRAAAGTTTAPVPPPIEKVPVENVPVGAQSTEPSTTAAFSPPNPNEVLSTRR
jgi:hypothetical protein